MIFEDIPASAAVFLDANIFVYYFQPHAVFGPPCDRLLQRIENKEVQGFTSSHVLGDMVHRLMAEEAVNLLGRSPTGIANWLKHHPAEVQRLSRYRQAIDEIAILGIVVLPVTGSLVSLAVDVTRQFGLLTNDALVVTVMRDHGLTLLASHDADFDRVPGLTRYAPA